MDRRNRDEAEEGEAAYRAHCLILPHPSQGHINPVLQFAKRLSHKRIKVTLALTKFLLKTATLTSVAPYISLRSISDGFDAGGRAHANSSDHYQSRFQEFGQITLSNLLLDLSASGRPVDCVIYDPFMPWASDVAKGLGIFAAAFFTQSCAVDWIYYKVYEGELKLPVAGADVVVDGLPAMKPEEMPSFVYDYGSCPGTFRMVLDQFRNVGKADWVFINTFGELEEEVLERAARFWRVKAIGPTIPSTYLDKRLTEDKEYGLTIFNPTTNDACMNWLNECQPKSVIYVSFGTLAQITTQQTEELARALTACGRHFLWAVRSSEESKLPPNFTKEVIESRKGLILSWCPQLEVLAHEAVACFITHCGWNSTLEGLSLGVPMVAMPQWTDQSTNAKFVVDVWGVGVRARAGEGGLVRREEIVECVKRVMEGENGRRINLNAVEWRNVARAAVDEGGSSDKNIEEFVCELTSSIAKVV